MKSLLRSEKRRRDFEIRSTGSSQDPHDVRPYGRFGGGLLTGHPAGLIVIAIVLVMTVWRIPETRLFFAGSVVLGMLIGLFLWLRHR